MAGFLKWRVVISYAVYARTVPRGFGGSMATAIASGRVLKRVAGVRIRRSRLTASEVIVGLRNLLSLRIWSATDGLAGHLCSTR